MKLEHPLAPRRAAWLSAALLSMPLSCQGEAAVDAPARGRDPWFFVSSAEDGAEALVLALTARLWVAYDVERASLLRVSSGAASGAGAGSGLETDPRANAESSLLTNAVRAPWRVLREGREQDITVRGRGYRLEGAGIVLLYDLQHEGRVVRIEERPEAVPLGDGAVGLERRFHMQGAPGELRVMLEFNAPALGSYDDVQLLSTEGEVRGLLTVTSSYDQRLLITFPPAPATERR